MLAEAIQLGRGWVGSAFIFSFPLKACGLSLDEAIGWNHQKQDAGPSAPLKNASLRMIAVLVGRSPKVQQQRLPQILRLATLAQDDKEVN
jgi:hypothetical protein